MPFDYEAFERELDFLGEDEVRSRYRRDEWLSLANRQRFVQDWLRSKDDARRDLREEMALSIARRANKIAISAMILAAAATILSAIITVLASK